jgi:hypothetical protein
MAGKRGRKPLWDEMDMPSRLEAVRGWAKLGSTDIEMCGMLEISQETFYKWKREKPEFAEAIKAGKHVSNGELVNGAFKQANGFFVTVTEPMKLRDVDGSEFIEMVTYEKYVPPNNTMAIFMLKNRLSKDFKDKQEVNHSGALPINIVVDYGGGDDDSSSDS